MPRLRTTGSAITFSASRKIGHTAASGSDSSTSRCRVIAPRRTSVGVDHDVTQLRRQVVDVDQVLGVGDAQLHHRQQTVAAGDEHRLVPQLIQQTDRVVDAGGALVLEWAGNLHVSQLTVTKPVHVNNLGGGVSSRSGFTAVSPA